MREIVSFFIGQAGVQSGMAIWELFCVEHNIGNDGHRLDNDLEQNGINTFFQKTCIETYVPRSLFVDLEPTVIDEIRTGNFSRLFHPDRMLTGPEDASNNFSRGFFTVGKLLLGSITTQIRHLVEQSELVMGMMLLRSLGGGTGAGLTSAMFEILSEYPKIPKIEVPIYPSPFLSTSMVEPYNCLLGEHFCMEDIDVGLLLDNEAMFDMCSRFLNVNYPTYCTINRLISQIASSITASIRFENVLNCDLSVLQTNLVPYPRIHFPLCNFAPILSHERALHQNLTAQELTRMVFDRQNQMMKIDHFYGRFMSCALFYRGNICPHHVYSALSEIKRDKSIEFVDWCPTGFKIGINVMQPVMIPENLFASTKKNVAMLTNTSAVGQAWQRLAHRFYLLYSKRSFIHWFVGEGMEECEFTEALYNISSLVKDYEEAAESYVSGEGDYGPDTASHGEKVIPSNNNKTENQNNCYKSKSYISQSQSQPSIKKHSIIDTDSLISNFSNGSIQNSKTKNINNSKHFADVVSYSNQSDLFSNTSSLVEDLSPVKSFSVAEIFRNSQLNQNKSNSTNAHLNAVGGYSQFNCNKSNFTNTVKNIHEKHKACKIKCNNNYINTPDVAKRVNFKSSKVLQIASDVFSNSSLNFHERSSSTSSKMSFSSNNQSPENSYTTYEYPKTLSQSSSKVYSIKSISIENKSNDVFNSQITSLDDCSSKYSINDIKNKLKEYVNETSVNNRPIFNNQLNLNKQPNVNNNLNLNNQPNVNNNLNLNNQPNVGLKPKKRHLRWVISKDSKTIPKSNDINQRLCDMIYSKSNKLTTESQNKNNVQLRGKQSIKKDAYNFR